MTAPKGKRLLSIDALRGFDMMFIMGLSAIIAATCRLFPGGEESWLYSQMFHAEWDGLFHHDTIFPLFLFISGLTFPFSTAKRLEAGATKKKVFLNTIRRGLILIGLGLVYNGLFDLDWSHLRFPSVLARIGIAWMLAAWIFLAAGRKARCVIAAVILTGYSFLLMIPAPDAPMEGSLSPLGSFPSYVDRLILGRHIYVPGQYDPEGILSTLPAIVTAMLGQFAGEFVQSSKNGRKTLWMLGAAAVLLGAGLVWSLWIPVNKALWSPSFVLVVGAYSLALFAVFYWLIDVKGWTRWTPFFAVVGMNSITIYLAQQIIPFRSVCEFFLGGAASYMNELWAEWLLALGYFAVCWLFLWFLYKKKVFLKV